MIIQEENVKIIKRSVENDVIVSKTSNDYTDNVKLNFKLDIIVQFQW